MEISLKLNSHEIREFIKEDGVHVSTDKRVSKTVTALDGTDFRRYKAKYRIEVEVLDDLISDNLSILKSYMTPNPAAVSFSNYETGETFSGTFYVSDLTHNIKKSYGGRALLKGISFLLEEK